MAKLKEKIEKLKTVLSPKQEKQTKEELRAEWFASLTGPEVKALNPQLYYEMREDWLRGFRVEDLDFAPEEPGFFTQFLP